MLVLRGLKRPVEALAFHPDGTRIAMAGGSDEPVELWELTSRTLAWTGSHLSYLLTDHIRFDPSGRWLLAAGGEEGFFAIEVQSGKSTRVGRFEDVDRVTVAPDGERVILSCSLPNQLVALELAEGGVGKQVWVQPLGGRRVSENWEVGGLDFFPSGDRFVTVEFRNRGSETFLRTRAAVDGRILDETPCACEGGHQVVLSADGMWAAFHTASHLLIYHMTDATRSLDLPGPNRKHITGNAFHPSGRYLAVTSNDKTVRLHDRDAGWAITRTFDWEIGKLKSVAFNAEGTLAAAGSETGQVVVWDVDL